MAVELSTSIITPLREQGDLKLVGDNLIRIGNIHERLGRPTKAQEHFYDALKVYRQIEYQSGMAESHYNLGYSHWSTNNWPESMMHYEKALVLEEEAGNQLKIAQILNNMGIILHKWGKHDDALRHYLKSYEIREEHGFNEGIPTVLVNIGSLYILQGNFTKAIEMLREALQKSREMQAPRKEGYALLILGVALEKDGQTKEAFDCFLKSEQAYLSAGDRVGSVYPMSGQARILGQRGETEKAKALFEKALAEASDLGDISREVLPQQDLGALYLRIGDYQKALFHLKRGVELSREIGERPKILQNLKLISDTYKEMGDFQNAYDTIIEYQTLSNQLSEDVSEVEIATLTSRFNAEKKEKENIILRKEKSLQKEVIRRQQLIFFLGTIILFLFMGLIIALIRSMRQRKKNHLLLEAAHENTLRQQDQLVEKNHSLQDALNKVNTLSGLLPICSTCKKIRDDQGYWQQVEVYINEHSDANFSHSICPDCASSYYKEIENFRAKRPKR